MIKNVLITGGAGFIGSHLADELLSFGYNVRVLDNLSPQVHGQSAAKPQYLNNEVEFIYGDVRNKKDILNALKNIDAVYHFAAMVGVGQSMYELEKYTSTNNLGTAMLLEALIKNPVRALVVASSMSVYGEGLYRTKSGCICPAAQRGLDQLKQGKWDIIDEAGQPLDPIPTPESKTCTLASIYALGKYDQEQMCLMIGRAYNIPTVAMRFFNVYGTRQSLSNPYTGVLAIFISRLLNNNPPLLFENGNQQRDFVSVYDVARACRLAIETPEAADKVFNIGSGRTFTIRQVAQSVAAAMDKSDIAPQITGKYRVGDIRNCFADISAARKILKYQPHISFENGLAELAQWVRGQTATDYAQLATAELHERRLMV